MFLTYFFGCLCVDYDDYDRSSMWISNSGSQNGDSRGSRSPYEINTWNSPTDRKPDISLHCVHMRGLPFKATQMDVFDVCAVALVVDCSFFLTFFVFL